MATTAKTSPKDKHLHAGSPRLTPRPTAASTARAARIATNRSQALNTQRSSPQRPSHSPSSSRIKALPPKETSTTNSKTEVKVPSDPEPDIFVIDQSSVLIIDRKDNNEEEEKNHEIGDTFVIKKLESNAPEDHVDCEVSGERPKTEEFVDSSRPDTPKNSSSSRPLTPKIAAETRSNTPSRLPTPTQRPTTPNRPTTPVKRPTTPTKQQPRSQPLNRSTTPVKSAIPAARSTQSALKTPSPIQPVPPTSMTLSQPCQKEPLDLISTYELQEKQFVQLKKELDLKQQSVLKLYDNLRDLRERMIQEGISAGGECLQQDIVLFNVADWTAEEISQLCRDAAAASSTEFVDDVMKSIAPIDEASLYDIDKKLKTLPDLFANLCLQAFTARQDIIDWVKDIIKPSEEGSGESVERIANFNKQGFELCDTLRSVKQHADETVKTVTIISRRACQEKSALLAVGESLLREIAKLRSDIESRNNNINVIREIRTDNFGDKTFEDVRKELEEERLANIATKDKLATAESHLKLARQRIAKMDRQLREADASISALTGTVKSLEDQNRQREAQLVGRARKLMDSLKTGEVTTTHLAQQRDDLLAEVQELKQQIINLTEKYNTDVNQLNNQLKDLNRALEKEVHNKSAETEAKRAAEVLLQESLQHIEELKGKLMDMENNKPNPELPTEREMELWAELQATKETLQMTEEEMTECKKEKMQFLETLTKISGTDNKIGMQQKLAAELLNKEEIIAKLHSQVRDLTKNVKLNAEKLIQYEQFVRDLQAHSKVMGNSHLPEGISYEDMQQEIMNLRMHLLDAKHHNEKLSDLLMQKEQQLDQQEKTSRAQARVIKVREELINMLKNKETEQSRELTALQKDLELRMKVVEEVNQQIAAKADEIQSLFSTLESKQLQIRRLEKIVVALEEQQRRAQAQRTRHEEKIAALEHELAATGNRERKFLIF